MSSPLAETPPETQTTEAQPQERPTAATPEPSSGEEAPDLVALEESTPPVDAPPTQPEQKRRWTWLPVIVLAIALILCVGLLAEEKRQTQLLANTVAGLEGQLDAANAAIDAYETRLTDIRTRVGTIFTQVADLRAVVNGDAAPPVVAPSAATAPAPQREVAPAPEPIVILEDPSPVAGPESNVGVSPLFEGDVFGADRFDPRTPAVF